MKTSAEIDKISEAMANAQGEYPILENNRKANYGGYADRLAILHAVRPILKKYKIAVYQGTQEIDGKIILFTKIVHAGQWIESSIPLNPNQNEKKPLDQSIGSTQSYQARYQLKLILGIESVNDKDDNDYEDYKEEQVRESIKIQPPSKKITQDQEEQLRVKLKDYVDLTKKLLELFGLDVTKGHTLKDIPVKDTQDFLKILNWCDKNIAALNK